MENYLNQPDEEFEQQASPTVEELSTETNSDNISTNGTTENSTDNTQQAESTTNAPEQIDYAGFYQKVMSPIKANGKEIQLESVDDVVSLMQKGANYTKKMQSIAPYRKSLYLLEQNNLLDPDALGLLIDAHKGDKEAIKKLLQNSKIDPLDIDADEPSTYQNKYSVSDETLNFDIAYKELAAEPQGQDTLQILQNDLDQESKRSLVQNPVQMQYLHEQRLNGTYKLVTDEMSRLETLGYQDPTTPFLQRYLEAGNRLMAKIQNTPISTRVSNSTGSNRNTNNLVRQAGLTKTSSRGGSGVSRNPLAMSDEEFMKQFGRN